MKTAMILAAGRGERLKPLTDALPKALCVVQGKPLIEHHVINLAKSGITRIVINHAYLGGHIRRYLGTGDRYGVSIYYSPEPPGGLETGGGIVNALPLLGTTPFITVNADIYTDFDFRQLQEVTKDFIHIILVPNNPSLNLHGDFGLLDKTLATNTPCDYTLAGICCYHPKVFAHSSVGRYSVAPLIRRYAEEHKVRATLYKGIWFDVGSLARLQEVAGTFF